MTNLAVPGSPCFCMVVAICILLSFTGCEKALDTGRPRSTPTAVFDDLWNVMDRHYAMFSFKGVDWNKSYQTYRARVNDNMSDEALFLVLTDMLEDLKDGHITLISGFNLSTYEGFHTGFPDNFDYMNLVNNYWGHDYRKIGPIIYKISDSIGYLYYDSFSDDVSEKQIDSIIGDMDPTRGLIVDIRNNTGGNSSNAEKLFERFISSEKIVKYTMTKKGPGHDDFFAPEPIYLLPRGKYYSHPVRVLTNRSCFSACNDFALYMSGLTNAMLIGDQTGGGGGIPYDYLLSNGWELQYSATMTLSPARVNIENGIQPGVNVGISTQDASAGKDPILEKAFQSLN